MANTTQQEAIATRTQAKERKAENNVLSEAELSAKHIKEAESKADKAQAQAEREVDATPVDDRPFGDNERANLYYKANRQY